MTKFFNGIILTSKLRRETFNLKTIFIPVDFMVEIVEQAKQKKRYEIKILKFSIIEKRCTH